jgi:PHP family Zn ribbon phosphoesterase
MKKIFTADNFIQLDQIRNLLIENGIECMHKGETSIGSGAAGGEVPPVAIRNELHVFEESEVEKAKALINEFLKTEMQSHDWVCDKCGEKIEKQFTHCWKCAEGTDSDL